MRRFLSTLLIAAAASFAPLPAFARGAKATVTVRVYDPFRRDYHRWDRGEEHEYRAYLAERHRAYRAYRRQRLEERRAYWRWRHEREERRERPR